MKRIILLLSIVLLSVTCVNAQKLMPDTRFVGTMQIDTKAIQPPVGPLGSIYIDDMGTLFTSDGVNWIGTGTYTPTLQQVTEEDSTTNIFTVFTGGVGSSLGNTTRFGINAANVAVGAGWTAIGSSTSALTTTGSNWVSVGDNAATQSNGDYWVSVGRISSGSNIFGDNWVAVGGKASRFLVNGIDGASSFENSTYIGYDTRVSENGVTNENVFGYSAIGKGPNTVSLGNSDITDIYSYGTYNTNATSPLNSSPNNVDATIGTVLTADGAGGSAWVPFDLSDYARLDGATFISEIVVNANIDADSYSIDGSTIINNTRDLLAVGNITATGHTGLTGTLTSTGNSTLSTNGVRTTVASATGAASDGIYTMSVGANTGGKSAIFAGEMNAISGSFGSNRPVSITNASIKIKNDPVTGYILNYGFVDQNDDVLSAFGAYGTAIYNYSYIGTAFDNYIVKFLPNKNTEFAGTVTAPTLISDVLKLTPAATAPLTPVLGEVYVNTDNHMYFYNGTAWVQLDN